MSPVRSRRLPFVQPICYQTCPFRVGSFVLCISQSLWCLLVVSEWTDCTPRLADVLNIVHPRDPESVVIWLSGGHKAPPFLHSPLARRMQRNTPPVSYLHHQSVLDVTRPACVLQALSGAQRHSRAISERCKLTSFTVFCQLQCHVLLE